MPDRGRTRSRRTLNTPPQLTHDWWFPADDARFAHQNCSHGEWDSFVADYPSTPRGPCGLLRPTDGAAGLLIQLA